MQLLEAKISSIITLTLGTILLGLIPSYFINQSQRQWPLLMSSLLCFGGGVLFSTSIVHILSEIRNIVPDQYQKYTEIVFCCGFFLLYIIDEIVHYFYDEHGHYKQIKRNSNFITIEHKRHSVERNYGTSVLLSERQPLIRLERQLPFNPSFYRSSRSDSELLNDRRPPSQLCHVGHQEPCRNGPVVNIGLLLALSVHALLEGIIVGLESSSSKVLLLLGAIASHKLVVSFCLGLELASNNLNTHCINFICIMIFALGSAGGIISGMLILNLPQRLTYISIPILQGLAGGTLLYITVSEVIPRERARWHQQNSRKLAGLCQCLSVFIGFSSMTLLHLYLESNH